MHDLAVNHHGRGGGNTQAFDLVTVLDLDDFNLNIQRPGSPFDHSDSAAALAAARSKNINFHLDDLVLEFIRQLTL